MGRTRHNGNKRNRRGKGNYNTNHAPTMQGIQETKAWILMDVIPILGGSGSVLEPFVVQMGAGVNGWYYDVRQGSSLTPVAQEAFQYGAFTAQFDELIPLWSTYRLDSVELIYYPLNPGSGQQSPCISAIDPAGTIGPVDESFTDVQVAFSRLRSVSITPPFKQMRRRVDYRSWLTQTCPQPWLLTTTGNDSSGDPVRAIYPQDPDDATAPNIRAVVQVVPQVAGTTLGFMHIKAQISLRGRRGVPLGSEDTVQRITFKSSKPHTKLQYEHELAEAIQKVQTLSITCKAKM